MFSFNGQSQDIKLTGQDRRDARNAELFINYRIIDSLLASQRFVVLKADYLETDTATGHMFSQTLILSGSIHRKLLYRLAQVLISG